MKTIVSCCVDTEVMKEVKRRGIKVSETLERALTIECALTNGIIKERIQAIIGERKKEINLLELRVADLESKEKSFELIKNMPEVIEAISTVKENPIWFEGRLRGLQNHHIQITEEQFRKLVWGNDIDNQS